MCVEICVLEKVQVETSCKKFTQKVHVKNFSKKFMQNVLVKKSCKNLCKIIT